MKIFYTEICSTYNQVGEKEMINNDRVSHSTVQS